MTYRDPRSWVWAEAKEKIEFVFLQDVDEAVRAVLEPRREAKTLAV